MTEPFQPQPATLPDIPTADIDWDVKLMANELGWEWDDEIGRYVDGDGTPVTEQETLSAVEAELSFWEDEIDSLSELLLAETIDVTEWEQRLADSVAAIAAIFFLFGLGTLDKLEDEHTDFVNKRLTTQYEYLRGFSEDISAGSLTTAMIGARSKLYVHDAESNHGYAQNYAHPVERWPYYSNVLGNPERHCNQCPAETAKGIVERGNLPAIGTRECGTRCHCHFAYYTEADARQRNSISRFGWVGRDSIVSTILIPVTS